MRRDWAIPVLFGILFFSTVFSAQDVYGPHYHTFDGVRYDFFPNGQAFFETSILLSEGLANTKKNANFEICVKLNDAEDTRAVPIEIVALDLVSCQPITVTKETDLNFVRVLVLIQTPPIFTPSMIVDVTGSYEIFNPAGKSMVGEIVFEEKDVVLGVAACIPPSCPNDCNNQGTCVADDVCICQPGFSGETCSFPDRCGDGVINPGEQCDDGNLADGDGCSAACQLEPSCPPNDCGEFGTCAANDVCVCDTGFSGELCTPDRCGDGVISPGEQCDDGNLQDGDGCSSTCTIELVDCDDNNPCTVDSLDFTGQCVNDSASADGLQCDDGAFCTVSDQCQSGVCSGVPNECFGLVCNEASEMCEVP